MHSFALCKKSHSACELYYCEGRSKVCRLTQLATAAVHHLLSLFDIVSVIDIYFLVGLKLTNYAYRNIIFMSRTDVNKIVLDLDSFVNQCGVKYKLLYTFSSVSAKA